MRKNKISKEKQEKLNIMFSGEIEIDKSYFGVIAKVKEDEELLERLLSLD